MTHSRARHLENAILKVATFSPLLGVLGHRQVGKTTVLERLCKSYFTLDRADELEAAVRDPHGYLQERAGRLVGIDECQVAPPLFRALKEWVRIHKRPGQFLLTGSVRFTSRSAIRESLTGRIVNLELLPFTIGELEGEPLARALPAALQAVTLERWLDELPVLRGPSRRRKSDLMRKYLVRGGLPGVCFVRDERLRHLKFDEQLRTLLDRDLRMVQRTTLGLHELMRFCSALSRMQGNPLDYTALRRETGISTPTVKKLLYALESIFVIRRLPMQGGGGRGHVVFFEDQGEASWLRARSDSLLSELRHLCFTHFRTQFEYRLGERTDAFHYATRGGAQVPLAYRCQGGVLGIVPIEEPADVRRALGSANSFLSAYPNAKVLIVHPEHERRIVQPRIALVPVLELL